MHAVPNLGGDWCEFCETKLSLGRNADGVHACVDCARELLEAQAKYEAEMAEVAGLHYGPNRKQRRAARRAALLRNNGTVKQ